MPIARVGLHHDGREIHRGMGVRENEVAGAEVEMHGQARDFIRTRDCVAVPVDDAGMLLEGELQQVADGGVVLRHVDALRGRLDETELAAVGVEVLGGIPDSPVAEIVAEVRVNLLFGKRADKHALCRHARVGRGRVQVAEEGIVDGLDVQVRLIVEDAVKSERAVLERNRGRESNRQNAAVLALQIRPLDPHLVVGDLVYALGVLFLAEDEVSALRRQRRVHAE